MLQRRWAALQMLLILGPISSLLYTAPSAQGKRPFAWNRKNGIVNCYRPESGNQSSRADPAVSRCCCAACPVDGWEVERGVYIYLRKVDLDIAKKGGGTMCSPNNVAIIRHGFFSSLCFGRCSAMFQVLASRDVCFVHWVCCYYTAFSASIVFCLSAAAR